VIVKKTLRNEEASRQNTWFAKGSAPDFQRHAGRRLAIHVFVGASSSSHFGKTAVVARFVMAGEGGVRSPQSHNENCCWRQRGKAGHGMAGTGRRDRYDEKKLGR
jgi:hypothetical protein